MWSAMTGVLLSCTADASGSRSLADPPESSSGLLPGPRLWGSHRNPACLAGRHSKVHERVTVLRAALWPHGEAGVTPWGKNREGEGRGFSKTCGHPPCYLSWDLGSHRWLERWALSVTLAAANPSNAISVALTRAGTYQEPNSTGRAWQARSCRKAPFAFPASSPV